MSSRREQDGHSPRLEAVIQKLEKTLLQSDSSSGDRSLTLQGDAEESGATSIPIAAHICQIIARNLAEQPAGESIEVSKLEESGALREHSSPGQMDDDQPLVKQTSLTERAYLYSTDLRKRVEQDLNIVIQKQTALLQEERSRSANLSQVNSLLREQLDQVDIVNKGLMESLRKTYASQSSREQARVIALWRQAASLRSTFTQLKTFTDRVLSDMRGECAAVSQLLHAACQNLETRAPEKSGSEMSALEMQLKDKLKETMQLQVSWDAEKVELNSRQSHSSLSTCPYFLNAVTSHLITFESPKMLKYSLKCRNRNLSFAHLFESLTDTNTNLIFFGTIIYQPSLIYKLRFSLSKEGWVTAHPRFIKSFDAMSEKNLGSMRKN